MSLEFKYYLGFRILRLGFSRAEVWPFLLLLFLFVFCNKLPVGEDEIKVRGDFDAQFIELTPVFKFTESKNIPLGASSNLIIGKNSEYESRILLQFDFPDTSIEGLDEIKLILQRNLKFKEDTITFSIHLLTTPFNETEATWHLKTISETWSTDGGDFEEDSLRFGEVREDSLVVSFNYIELEQIRSAQGLIIIPQDSGFVGFYSRESGVAPQFQLVKNNVTTSVPIEADCHILTGPEPFYIETWIGSGMGYRNFVQFDFTVDSLLPGEKIVFADLSFKAFKHFSMRDSFEIGVKELTEHFDDYDTPTGPALSVESHSVHDTLFSLDIVEHVQRVIDEPDSNFGLFIYVSPENYDISSFQIVDDSYLLRVGYIPPPEERW